MNNKEFISIGTMSGTSMDGIDVSALKTDGKNQIQEIGYYSLKYSPEFHHELKQLEKITKAAKGNLDQTAHTVIQRSTELHYQAIAELIHQLKLTPKQIDCIGYHGQTLYHAPHEKITVQIGDGQWLAKKLGITTVTDFRKNDIAAGGQGAPFAPLYHQALAIRDHKIPLAIVNCGGIANVSFIKGPTFNDLLGFDTGPGNGLIDRFVKQKTQNKETMDYDGQYGLRGTINKTALEKLRQTYYVYLQKKPPKSFDINDFDLIAEINNLSIEDGCAILEAFTADCIAQSIHLVDKSYHAKHWVLLGGGSHNPVIKKELETRLGLTLSETSWNNASFEAQIFAWLAVRSILKLPLSIPATTGVPEPLTGGSIYS